MAVVGGSGLSKAFVPGRVTRDVGADPASVRKLPFATLNFAVVVPAEQAFPADVDGLAVSVEDGGDDSGVAGQHPSQRRADLGTGGQHPASDPVDRGLQGDDPDLGLPTVPTRGGRGCGADSVSRTAEMIAAPSASKRPR